jgi:uncharacterized membrane protein YdbT with pleckstrin-like domain
MIPLAKVTNIQVRRSALGRFLGYGEIIIESAGQRRIAEILSRIRNKSPLN